MSHARSWWGSAARVRGVPSALIVCLIIVLPGTRVAAGQFDGLAWQTATIGSSSSNASRDGTVRLGHCAIGPTDPSADCDELSMTSEGKDIWGSSDEFTFAYRQMLGDGVIVARVRALQATDAWSKAGVMIRESLSPGSPHALLLTSGRHGLAFQRRLQASGPSVHTDGGAGAAPVWLKLERRGSILTAYRSGNGVRWTTVETEFLPLSASVYVGLAVTSHAPGRTTMARFSDISIRALSPDDFTSTDIGSPSRAGTTSQTGPGAFTLEAGGRDVWGTSDQFRFAYQVASGDVDIVARVTSVTQAHAWSKAGVMMRASLGRSAAHASVFASAAKGVAFQRRLSPARISTHTGADAGPPVWLKLERRREVVTAFMSNDGALWQVIGSDVIDLPETFLVGLAVTSHAPSALTTARFDDVSIVRVTEQPNTPPDVRLRLPDVTATFPLGSLVNLGAVAEDADGTVTRVDFFVNGALVGFDASAPYAIPWTPPTAGRYVVTALAHDDRGASTTTDQGVIQVVAPSVPARLVFTASADHATLVDWYVLEIFAAGRSPATATPVLTQNVGKPSVARGECAVDVGGLLDGLPPGSYVAAVRAIGVGGSSLSEASGAFLR